MTVPHSVRDVLGKHVVLESESIDQMYLNGDVPQLQRIGGVVWYLRGHLGQRFASTVGVTPKTDQFVASIDKFAAERGVDIVGFTKGQRKDDVTQQYLSECEATEGVLYVGRAQEKARVVRTEKPRNERTGMSYPWVVDGSAMVNHHYFYCVDEDFGPFFLKFCCFAYNAKLCINGNEYAKSESPHKGKTGLRQVWNAFLYAMVGLRAAFRHEDAFRQECILASILIPVALFLPASGTGKALMVGSVLLVLIVELLHSAVEATVDRISIEHHDLAMRAKDIGSAAVFTSLMNVAVVWALGLFG